MICSYVKRNLILQYCNRFQRVPAWTLKLLHYEHRTDKQKCFECIVHVITINMPAIFDSTIKKVVRMF